MQFEFSTSAKIIFGTNTVEKLGEIVRSFGKSAVVVTGGGSVDLESILEALNIHQIHWKIFRVYHEPDVELIENGSKFVKSNKFDVVIAIGGGSVIDAAKGISALAVNDGNLFRYLENIGEGLPFENIPLPIIAIPTTAGTGSEVTKNAVIYSEKHRTKVSLRSLHLIPKIALIDPVLTYSVPPKITASSGMDALTQLIEAYTTKEPNPITDVIALEGVRNVVKYVELAFTEGNNQEAREGMCLASLFGGLALANSGLGAVHGLANVIGGMFSAPHGTICERLLCSVMKANIHAMQSDLRYEANLKRFEEINAIISLERKNFSQNGLQWIDTLVKSFDLQGLNQFGVTENHFEEIIKNARESSSMRKNPVSLADETLVNILSECL